MRKMTLVEWEKKYVAGPIEQFDSRYQMFSRPMWDPQIKDLLKNWGIAGTAQEKAGYTLEDQALRWGSNAGTAVSRPASPQTSPMAGIMSYQVPEGMHTNDSDPAELTLMIKKAARWFGADLVGICELDRRWLYAADENAPMSRDVPESIKYAIVLGYEMDYELVKYFNTYAANAATRMGYSRMAVTNAHLASFIRYLGFQAIESGNDLGLSVPMAMQAGLGEIGRNGILVTPEFGPRIRLSKVLTDLPLVPDSPIDFGVTEFCLACEKCADSCPSRSIMKGGRTTDIVNASNNPGALKWPINAETCRTYWSRVQAPCVSCIATCPYNKEFTLLHRAVRWFTDHARWADALYVKMDDLLGYGKPKKAGNFWHEWQPGNGYSRRR